MEFYPSITETVLDNAISCPLQHTSIAEVDLRIIRHCWKSLLYNDNEPWKKKDTNSCFDMTMGGYDGGEICELVGNHLLSLLANTIGKKDCDLYRHDGLIILRNTNGQKMEQIGMSVIKISKDVSFKTEVKSNLKIFHILNVTFNLSNDTRSPTIIYYM